MRALATLGSQYGQEIRDPRAWLLRVASNAWLDRVRRASFDREQLGAAADLSAAPLAAEDLTPEPLRLELVHHRGELLALVWYAHTTGPAVRAFYRFTLDPSSSLIATLREYYYAPEALTELATELALPYRSRLRDLKRGPPRPSRVPSGLTMQSPAPSLGG